MNKRVEIILNGLRNRERSALARAITLLESRRVQDREDRLALLEGCASIAQSHGTSSVRLAVTGAPGVGKSTLINQLGLATIEAGHRVAVLAVDPSSEATGGSILGDKTRMAELSVAEDAFIRPSPTSGYLGGVAASTRESILACEAAGFDRIVIETVGVGQSEYQASHLVDVVLFVTIAGAGDGLQGIKRGILESVDLVAVNKADGDEQARAKDHARELGSALRLLRGSSSPSCIPTSSLSTPGITPLFEALGALTAERLASGAIEAQREDQQLIWYRDAVRALLEQELQERSTWNSHYEHLAEDVRLGNISPYHAAATLVSQMFGDRT